MAKRESSKFASMRRLPFVACALLCVQCLTPAADRAKRDETIGKAQATTYAVSVVDGLAAVRSATPDKLLLWQSAPSLTLEFEIVRAEPFVLEVRNTMPGALLTVVGGDAAVEERSARGKTRVFVINPRDMGALTLELAPAETSVVPFRFALMSDVQEAVVAVSDVFAVVNREPNLDFLLGAGDLTQRGSRSELERFERELEGLRIPYYTTLGNHELGAEPTAYQELFGRGSFSFVHRGARFTLLDSASATLDSLAYGWLDEWLTRGANQFHLVGMHIPPLDPTGVRNGAFASRDEAMDLISKLQARNVDLTVYGHIHSFYDFDTAGIPAVISGGGGAIPERFDNIGRHVVVFDVDPVRQTFTKTLVHVD